MVEYFLAEINVTFTWTEFHYPIMKQDTDKFYKQGLDYLIQ